MRRLLAISVAVIAISTAPAAQMGPDGKKGKPGRFDAYPTKPYCSVCLRKKKIDGPARSGRLMERDAQIVLDDIGSKRLVYIETEDFKLVSTIPGCRLSPSTAPRLLEELPKLRERFPRVKGKYPKLDGHQFAHLLALHMHRCKLEFWEIFGTRASSYSGYMNRKAKHEIYLFGRQRDYDRFTDRFTGKAANGGQEIILRNDDAIGFARPPPDRGGPNTWNNAVIHMWAHLLLECQIRNGFNMPSWLDAGFAHWFERRESTETNTYCFSESRNVGEFRGSSWRSRVRRLVLTNRAPNFAEFSEIRDLSSLGGIEHGISFSLVDYILAEHRVGLRKFLRELGRAKQLQHNATFKRAFGRSVPAFFEEWKAWVKKAYRGR